jgi:streptogramin lyase
MLRVDPATNRVTDAIPIVSRPRDLSPYPYMVALGERFVWVVNGNTNTVTKIDPSLRGVVATIPLEHVANSLGLTVGEGAAWVVDGADGKLLRIDAKTDAVTSIPLGFNQPQDAAVADGNVWVSVQTP